MYYSLNFVSKEKLLEENTTPNKRDPLPQSCHL